jgi:chemotaxis protein histidine kinase CheA
MSTLDRQIRSARTRLDTNVLLAKAASCVLAAAGAWSVFVIVQRALAWPVPAIVTLAVAIAATTVATLVAFLMARTSDLSAAVAIDQAAGLKERVSTALAVARSSDPFARAAVRDAEKAAGAVHVPAHVPIRAPSQWPWSAAMIVAAGLIYAFMPQLNLFAGQQAKPTENATVSAEEKKSVEITVNEQLNKVKKMVEDNPGLKDLAKDLEPLQMPDTPGLQPEDIRREAMKKLDKVAQSLEEKRESPQLRSLDELKREMSKIEPNQGKDPTAKLTQALASGDMESAKKSLSEMKKELEDAAKNGDEAAKQKMGEMAAKLDDLAKQLEKLADTAKLEKELENKGGLSKEEAKKLADELSKMDPKDLEKKLQQALGEKMSAKQLQELAKKLQDQQEAKKACKNMAQAMAKAAKACQNPGQGQGQNQGEAQQAAQALGEAMAQMSEMEMAEQMMNEIEMQLQELKDAQAGMCEGNQGDKKGDKPGPQGGNEGIGYGARIGREAGAHKYKPTKVNARSQGGQIIGQMMIDGPQIKGESGAEVRNAINAAVRDATDAIERDEIPRQYHEVAKRYFERLAGLGGIPPRPADDKSKSDEKSKDEGKAETPEKSEGGE